MQTQDQYAPRSEEEREMFARLWEEQNEIYRQGGYYRCPPGMDEETHSRYARFCQLNSKFFQEADLYLAQLEKEEQEAEARAKEQAQ